MYSGHSPKVRRTNTHHARRREEQRWRVRDVKCDCYNGGAAGQKRQKNMYLRASVLFFTAFGTHSPLHHAVPQRRSLYMA